MLKITGLFLISCMTLFFLSSCGVEITGQDDKLLGGPSINAAEGVSESNRSISKAGAGLSRPKPYKVNGQWYQPSATSDGYEETGIASWYGRDFHGRTTSSGESYDMYSMTAAHKTLPFNTYVKITRIDDGRSIVVRINDRGPFVRGRIIDLSFSAAEKLDIIEEGTAVVKIEALGYKEGDLYVKRTDYLSGQFTVQVGAFAEKVNAVKLVSSLKSLFGEAAIFEYGVGDVRLFRVRVGRFQSLAEAQDALEELQDMGMDSSFIVSVR